jgi:hypothetical protein
MDKVAVNEAKEAKRKQKKNRRLKKTTNTPTLEEQIALREKVKGKKKATFDAQWSPIISTITPAEWATL